MWASLAAVFVGGLIGTAARLGVDLLIPHETPGALAWSTVVVNVMGSFLLSLLVATLWRRASFPNWLRAGLGAGVMGSFTTFSAMALNSVAATAEGNLLAAVVATLTSVVLGLGAAWAGLSLGGISRSRASIPDDGADI